MIGVAASMKIWCVALVVLGFWMLCFVPRVVVGDPVRPVLRFNSEGTFKILQVIDSFVDISVISEETL